MKVSEFQVAKFQVGEFPDVETARSEFRARATVALAALFSSSLVLISGCGTTSGTADSNRASPTVVSPATEAASAASAINSKPTLLSEERRLADLFRGTPVVFTMQADGAMRAEIPLTFCFDEGKSKVKPPLAAVLDRIALSQAAEATHVSLAAPIDASAKNQALGVERAIAVRKYLVQKGVAETRFLAVAVSTSGNLRIVVANKSLP